MKVSIVTPAGTREVEIPPETETLRVGFYRDSNGACIDVNIDATWHEGRDQDAPIAQHLLGTWIDYAVPEFGDITPTEVEQ